MIAYLISFALSGNELDNAYNEILQANCSFITPIQFKDHRLNISDSILNDFKISIGCQLSTGIDQDFISKNGKNKKDVLQNMAKIINLIIDKNICIVYWDASNGVLTALENNFKQNNIDFDSSKLINYKNAINIKQLAELIIPVSELNGSNYLFDNVLFYLKNKYSGISVQNFIDTYIKSKKPETNCSDFCKNMFFILQQLMKEKSFTTFSQVVAWLNEPHLLSKITFGKYKDKTFEYVMENDIQYLHWLKKSNLEYISNSKDVVFTINSLLNDINK